MGLVLSMLSGSSKGKVAVSPVTFGREFNGPLVHQVVTAYLAGGRSGTKAQKTRAEVRGGGAKPWNQKGSGRARAGTSRSPIWVGGGRTFAAKPRDFEQKVNRKMYRGAMRSILSELVRQQRLIVVKYDDLKLEVPKTKELLKKLNGYCEANQGTLLVLEDWDANLYLAGRNIPKVGFMEVRNIDPVSLIKHKYILITEEAIRKIEEVLG